MMNIAVIPNIHKDMGLVTTKRVIRAIGKNANVLMDSMYNTGQFEARFSAGNVLESADAVIVLGGDGTILQVASECAKSEIPILGINLGRIGFMSEVEEEEVENAVGRLLAGDYEIEKRMMIQTEIRRDGQIQGTFHSLNDVVVSKTADVKLISTEVYSGNEKINEYISDGLIISTPTGSTGYNLSAGGPVINPNMKLLAATPICAHMLMARPMIIPDIPAITVRMGDKVSVNEAIVTADGDNIGYIKTGDEIIISRSTYETRLIKLGTSSFYDILIKKLS